MACFALVRAAAACSVCAAVDAASCRQVHSGGAPHADPALSPEASRAYKSNQTCACRLLTRNLLRCRSETLSARSSTAAERCWPTLARVCVAASPRTTTTPARSWDFVMTLIWTIWTMFWRTRTRTTTRTPAVPLNTQAARPRLAEAAGRSGSRRLLPSSPCKRRVGFAVPRRRRPLKSLAWDGSVRLCFVDDGNKTVVNLDSDGLRSLLHRVGAQQRCDGAAQ